MAELRIEPTLNPAHPHARTMGMRITIRQGGTALCPLCKEALSREAKKCPHCQSDLTDNAEWKAIQQSKGGCMPLILLVLLILSSYAFAVEAPLFQQLQTGDSIYVTYSSNGCFHSVTYEFEFKHGVAVTAQITEVALVPGTKGKDSREEIRTLLGTVTLTASELAGLDRLFEFYRKGVQGGCTTQDRIKATYKVGGVTTATETFADNTCDAPTLRDVTLLETLPEKLKKKPK